MPTAASSTPCCVTSVSWTTRVNWFTNQWSFYAIVLLNVVHHGFPFVAITVLAGLLGVSKEMLEAAALDGAGAWRRFWKIIFPTLKPVFSVVIILSTIWDFKVFAQSVPDARRRVAVATVRC